LMNMKSSRTSYWEQRRDKLRVGHALLAFCLSFCLHGSHQNIANNRAVSITNPRNTSVISQNWIYDIVFHCAFRSTGEESLHMYVDQYFSILRTMAAQLELFASGASCSLPLGSSHRVNGIWGMSSKVSLAFHACVRANLTHVWPRERCKG
jgi:hypothetical protein